METRTTIIIPNYNGLKFMEPCFEALEHQTVKNFKILVVDNGSTDGSVEWLKEHKIPTIFLPENTGFTGAVNVGIKACDTPYLILLNNDTKAEPRFVEVLEKAISRSDKIFSVCSKMIQMYHPDLMDDAGDMYSVLGWAYQRGVGRPIGLYDKPRKIFSSCAAASIYRKSVFDEMGLFDPMHFAYLEDIDVGYRAKLYGYDNIYCPDAVIYHVGSGTSGSKYNTFKVRLAARNNVYLNYKNMATWQLVLNFPFLAAGTAVKYLFFKKMGFGKDYLSAFWEGVRTRKQCTKVPDRPGRFKEELKIQMELYWGTILYIYEFSRRQTAKLKKK